MTQSPQASTAGLASTSVQRPARLGALTNSECLDLLEHHEVGRVGFTTTSGPRIYPVNYAMDADTVVIRTSPYADLFVNLTGLVAFEIDEIDSASHGGWSVLVVGVASPVDDPDEAIRLRRHGKPESWADGERNAFVRITPRETTGRRLG